MLLNTLIIVTYINVYEHYNCKNIKKYIINK